MIGIDTNVLVRFFVQDDPRQTEIARRFLMACTPVRPGFISAVVIAELVWALDGIYGYDRHQIHDALVLLTSSANIAIEREMLIKASIETGYAANADLADSVIAALALDAGCVNTVTFDKAAAKRIPGMELLA